MTDRRSLFKCFAGSIAAALAAIFLKPEQPETYLCFDVNDDGTVDSWEVDANLQGVPGTYRQVAKPRDLDPDHRWNKALGVFKYYPDGSRVFALPRSS